MGGDPTALGDLEMMIKYNTNNNHADSIMELCTAEQIQ
jgi:hypothetical protein